MSAAHREAAIAHTRAAVEAEAAAASKAKGAKGGPGVHVLPLFQSALKTMEAAHEIAKASDPGGSEQTGVSKLSEDDVYRAYAAQTGVTTREAR
jgi:hypothetical protein